MEGELASAKHELLRIQEMLEMAEKVLLYFVCSFIEAISYSLWE
jgi:hypothetical protein